MHSWHVLFSGLETKNFPSGTEKKQKAAKKGRTTFFFYISVQPLPAKNSLGADLTLEVETFQSVKLLSLTTKFVVINLRNWLINKSAVLESGTSFLDPWLGRLEFLAPEDLARGAWPTPALEAMESKSEVWNCFKLFSNHPVCTEVSGEYRIHIDRSPHAKWYG